MDLIFLSYIPVIAGLCLLGLAAYVNNPAARVNKLFTVFTVLIALWLLLLYFADSASSDSRALWSLRFALVASPAASFSFLLLGDSFPSEKMRTLSGRSIAILGAITSIFMLLSLTDLIAPGITRTSAGVTLEPLTALYSVHTVLLVGEIIAGVVIISRRRKTASVTQRAQIRLFSYGAVLAVLIALIPGFVFMVFGIESALTAFLTGLSFFVFALFVMVAITRHQLFNIRSVVARSVAYVLSALVIAVFYALLVGVVIERSVDSQAVRVTLTGVSALVGVLIFGSIKATFDKITNRMFYREAYSSRDKLYLLTSKLVSHIELDKLVSDGASVIKSALKPQKFAIVIHSGSSDHVFGQKFTIDQKLLASLTSQKRSYVLTGSLDETVAEELRSSGIELVVPVRSAKGTEGLIVLGPRASGEVYSHQDLSFLTIAARNIGMAVNNAKNYQEIADFNKTLSAKVQKATGELRTKNRELESLHKTKDDFISMASHQLRPKIAASQGFLDLLDASGLKKTKNQAELLDLAAQGIERMSDIVVDMLDVSRMDANRIVLDYSIAPIDIVKVVSDEISNLEGTKKLKRFKLQYKPKGIEAQAHVDVVKIREVISNLLNNADQYSPENTVINVEITRSSTGIKITVKDKGFGMEKSEQSRIFEKFYRSDSAKIVRPTGSGVGLYMSKKIVEAHGGLMIVSSQKDKGSSIGFQLPAHL